MIGDDFAHERRLVAPRLPRLLPRRLRSLHTLALVLVLALCSWLAWTWYRGSSFVRVQRVEVTGLSGPDVPQIRAALTGAALQMTTLAINMRKLEASVAQYDYVHSLAVTSAGKHAVVIRVAERVPVATVAVGGRQQVVDGDGRLLPSSAIAHMQLPQVPLTMAPAADTITAPGARAAITVLAAAPYALLGHIASATSSSAHGVIVQLRHGPQLYFGPVTQLALKWNAAVAVLRSRYAAGASYIDLTDPQRPAPGVDVSPSQAGTLGLTTG